MIELTSKCNMSCKFCPFPVMKRPRQDLKDELVLKIIEEIKNYQFYVTFHVLGEPLLNKNFFKYAKLLDDYNIKYWLNTNGTLLTDKNIDKLANLKNLWMIIISWQTIDENDFKIRNSNISYDLFISRMKSLIFSESRYKRNIQLYFNIMYDKGLYPTWNIFNRQKWLKFSDLCRQWRDELYNIHKGVKERFPEFFKTERKVFEGNNYYYYTDFKDIPDNLFEDLPMHITTIIWEIFPNVRIKLYKFFHFTKNPEYLKHSFGQQFDISNDCGGKCKYGRELTILSNGEISTCCIDYNGELSCGNIETMTLAEAMQSKERDIFLKNRKKYNVCKLCMGEIIQ